MEKSVPGGVIARIGSWCFRRRWWVAFAWLALFGAGLLAGGEVLATVAATVQEENVEADLGAAVLADAANSSGDVVGMVDDVDIDAPGVRESVLSAAADLGRLPGVGAVACPYTPGLTSAEAGAYRDGGRGLLVVATLSKMDLNRQGEVIDAVSERLRRLEAQLHGGGQLQARVRVGGEPVIWYQVDTAVQDDLNRGEAIALPITLVVMVLVFGSVIAGLMPLFTALVSAAVAMLLVWGFTTVTAVSADVVTVVTVLGLGLSIDYALLLVGRYREELFAGHDPALAVARAWATAGRTVAFSALIMAAALAGLFAFDLVSMRTFAAAGLCVAVVAMAVSLTLVAALVAMAGRRIRPAAPATHLRRSPRRLDLVAAFVRAVVVAQRRPWVVVLVTGALLLLAGVPLLTGTLRSTGLAALPRDIESVQVADELAGRYGIVDDQRVTVLARSGPETVDAWVAPFANDPTVTRIEPATIPGPGLAAAELYVRDSQSAEARELVRSLRAVRPPDTQSWVTGEAAILLDVTAPLVDGAPYAAAITLLAVFVLLFAMTGSLVVPVKAVLANVVSLGATVGVMILVFEHGVLAGLLDTTTVGGLEPGLVVTVVVFAFAFSVDYEVFLLGRVAERVERERGAHADAAGLARLTDTAVREGIQHTGKIVTSAALLMFIVFCGFAAGRVSSVEQIGVGLAVAILVDATVVRLLLVPASMTLLGRWNWWAPAPLERLHDRIGLRERPLPDGVGAPW